MSVIRRERVAIVPGIELTDSELAFVVEYMKDFAPRRAAEASGHSPDTGYDIRNRPMVCAAIDHILKERLEANCIDADWLLGEMVDNHRLARQQGNISASNTALNMVGKHKRVDAFAADKIKVSTDADVVDALVAARRRLAATKENDDVSFL